MNLSPREKPLFAKQYHKLRTEAESKLFFCFSRSGKFEFRYSGFNLASRGGPLLAEGKIQGYFFAQGLKTQVPLSDK